MAEWLKAHAWKACKGETLSWVRIPFSPPLTNFYMIKRFINRNSIFYKPYLFFRIFWLEKFFLKKKSYSQCGEDIFILEFFKDKISKGIYLDIGAFNPIKFNNTYLLHKKGWKGTNIDLNQTSIDLFNILRPNDENICAAISDKVEKVEVYIENLFSPLNTISPDRFKLFDNDKLKGKTYFIETKMINNLINHKFDFLNIDIEGLDIKVLKSINLKFYNPKLICIEILNSKNEIELSDYLMGHGYYFEKKMGPSYFFSKNS